MVDKVLNKVADDEVIDEDLIRKMIEDGTLTGEG